MSNYIKATNFAAKDSLPVGEANKKLKGVEIDNEFNAIANAISTKSDSNSPTFTGTPVAPTASAATNNTQIATTAFVQAQKASPALTGTPTAPTASAGTNTTQIATTEYVTSAVSDAIFTGGAVDNETTFGSTVTVSDTLIVGAAIDETVYNLTGTELDPSNGTVQFKTLSANTTFTSVIAEGESMTLMIDDGSAYTVTWPSVTWVNNEGEAPELATSGFTVVTLWNVGGSVYGALVGNGQ